MAESDANEKRFVASCPVCSGRLNVTQLTCSACATTIQTTLPAPPFFRLPPDLQQFVHTFLACRGNIREVEKRLGISYPTVNKRLDVINAVLGEQPIPAATESGSADDEPTPPPRTPRQVLKQLENGEINAQQAARLLKQLDS
jgi:hypothetical protein